MPSLRSIPIGSCKLANCFGQKAKTSTVSLVNDELNSTAQCRKLFSIIVPLLGGQSAVSGRKRIQYIMETH